MVNHTKNNSSATKCLSVFDHFAALALRGLNTSLIISRMICKTYDDFDFAVSLKSTDNLIVVLLGLRKSDYKCI